MNKRLIIFVAVIVFMIAAWVCAGKKKAKTGFPPAGGKKLIGFLEARPPTESVCKFVHNGTGYVQVIGKPNVSPLSLPSGPPVYIFDETGVLVDWSRDIGDSPSFTRKWGGFSNATPISVEEAKRLLKPRS